MVIVVGDRVDAGKRAAGPAADVLEEARAEVERLAASGVARGEAARRVAATTGISRRRLYGADRDR